MKALGIHNMSAVDLDPLQLVAVAAQLGCQEVSVFVRAQGLQGQFPLVTAELRDTFMHALKAHNLRVGNIESFMLTPDTDIASLRDAVALGESLGARGVTAILRDPDRERIVGNLRALCDLAAEFKLKVGIEFMPLMPFWSNLQQVNELIDAVDRHNLGIGVDILHLIRSGGTPNDLKALPAGRIAYAQLCDSDSLEVTSQYGAEAVQGRLAPGKGKFPIQAFLRALPADVPVELEVPCASTQATPERLAEVVQSTRAQMALAGIH